MDNIDNLQNAKRVFLVDDDKDTLLVMRYLFESTCAQVIGVNQPEKALDEFLASTEQDRSFDLVVLDIRMPRVDGYELAKRFREQGFKGPIVGLTATASEEGHQRSLECGFDYYLAKGELTKSMVAGFFKAKNG